MLAALKESALSSFFPPSSTPSLYLRLKLCCIWAGWVVCCCMMAAAFSLPTNCSGVFPVSFNRIPFSLQRPDDRIHARVSTVSGKVLKRTVLHSLASSSFRLSAVSRGRNDGPLSSKADSSEEPFWEGLIKEAIWGMKSLAAFLSAQPSQLKYIEWPGFRGTLKTAILTLVLVAALIVSLASVDSALSYVLALSLRRTPK